MLTFPSGLTPVYNRTPDGRNSPTAQILSRFLGKPDITSQYRGGLSDIVAGYFSGSLKTSEEPPYPGLDEPPAVVWGLLGHLFTSKLHKFLMLDLVSLGCGEEIVIKFSDRPIAGNVRLRGSLDSNNSPRTRDRYGMTPRSRTSSSRSGSSTKSGEVGSRTDADSRKNSTPLASVIIAKRASIRTL